MEGVIGSIVTKIDMVGGEIIRGGYFNIHFQVLIKLESMEKVKSRKKEDLSKMFDVFGDDGEIYLMCNILY